MADYLDDFPLPGPLPAGWMPVEDCAENRRLIDELGRETSPGHRLHDVPYRAVARATGSDDVMLEIGHAGPGYAIVHLTFQRERDPRWPRTEVYATWPEAVGAAAAIALGEPTSELTFLAFRGYSAGGRKTTPENQ